MCIQATAHNGWSDFELEIKILLFNLCVAGLGGDLGQLSRGEKLIFFVVHEAFLELHGQQTSAATFFWTIEGNKDVFKKIFKKKLKKTEIQDKQKSLSRNPCFWKLWDSKLIWKDVFYSMF